MFCLIPCSRVSWLCVSFWLYCIVFLEIAATKFPCTATHCAYIWLWRVQQFFRIAECLFFAQLHLHFSRFLLVYNVFLATRVVCVHVLACWLSCASWIVCFISAESLGEVRVIFMYRNFIIIFISFVVLSYARTWRRHMLVSSVCPSLCQSVRHTLVWVRTSNGNMLSM